MEQDDAQTCHSCGARLEVARAWHPALVPAIACGVMALLFILVVVPYVNERRWRRGSICLTNLKMIGLAMIVYSQDYNDFFPRTAASDKDVTTIGCLSLLRPSYISAQKTFTCPSDIRRNTTVYAAVGESESEIPAMSRDLQHDATGHPHTTGCSYAYAIGCDGTDDPDTVLACDKVGTPGEKWDVWIIAGTKPCNRENTNHGNSGVNVLFVGGHAKWAPKDKCHPDPTTGGLFPNINNAPRSRGAVMNP